jgi:hypothetical protein
MTNVLDPVLGMRLGRRGERGDAEEGWARDRRGEGGEGIEGPVRDWVDPTKGVSTWGLEAAELDDPTPIDTCPSRRSVVLAPIMSRLLEGRWELDCVGTSA